MHYIDFHVHIDFYDNPDLVMDMYEQSKIYAIFVTNLPELFIMHQSRMKEYQYIRLAMGYHPEMVMQYGFKKKLFKEHLHLTNYIGEVGLDKSIKQQEHIKKQFDVFNYVTQKKFSKGKIYNLHCRGYEQEILQILNLNGVKSAVFHWYSGSISNIKKIADAGYYFSINPNMLKSNKGLNTLREIPKERILFETDGPFCRFNKKVVTPDIIPLLYDNVSSYIGYSIKDVVYNNFKRLLLQTQLYRIK